MSIRKRHSIYSRLKRKLRHRLAEFLDFSRRLPFYGVLCLLILFSLFYAGGGHWWLPAALSCTLLLTLIWLLRSWWQGGKKLTVRLHTGMLLILLPLLAGLAQLLPIGAMTRFLSPRAWQSWSSFQELGLGEVSAKLTLAPEATWLKCQLLLLCLMIFFLLFQYARHRRNLLLIMTTVVAAALGNALIAYWQFFAVQSGEGLQDVFAGNFENRNHFGFMMSLGILSALGLLSCIKKDSDRRIPHQPAWSKLRVPLVFSFFLLVIAQVLSLSRGAFLSTCLMLCVYVTLWWFLSHASSDKRKVVTALFIVLLSALLFSLQTGLSMLVERYQSIIEQDVFDTDTRISFWKDTLSMANDFPLTGAGLGAYRDAFQAYESGKVTSVLADHAHNDWLEFLAEMGWPLTILLLAGLSLLLLQLGRRLWRQQDSTLRWLGFAAMAAILAGMIHECFDFNLQAMSNAILFSALLAVLCSCARNKSVKPGESSSEPEYGWLHPQRVAFLLCALLLLIAVLPRQVHKLRAAIINDRLRGHLQGQAAFSQPRRNDYLRWSDWADQALQISPDSGRLHFWKAVCAVRLAELASAEEAAQHWQTAMDEMAKACRNFPSKGEFMLDCAEIYEAGALHLDLPIQEQVLAIYRRAWQCQPRLLLTVSRVADAYRRLYWQMLTDDKMTQEAEALRLQTMRLYSQFLRLTPYRAKEVFAQINEICDSDEELLALTPQNLFLQRELLEHLTQRQVYDLAFKLLEDNKKDWQEESGNERSLINWRDWHEWQYTLLGLTRQWEQRQKLLPAFHDLALRCLEKQIPYFPINANSTLLQESELTLATLIRQPPRSCKVLKHYAKWQAHFGQHAEISAVLLPMICNTYPMPLECLQETNTLLRTTDDEKHAGNERDRFLRNALAVCIAEQDPEQQAKTSEWLQNLRDLEMTAANDDKRSPWLQRHLYPLFQGRVHFLRQEFSAAADAYQRSREISGDNLLLWTHWQKLPPEFHPVELPDWVLAMREGMPLNFRFTNSIVLLTVKVSQPLLSSFHESSDVEFFWYCNGDILEDCQVQISFQNPSAVLFKDAFSFVELQKPMINWRIGEVVSCKRRYQPLLKTVQGGNPVTDSDIVATVQLTSLFQNSQRVYKGAPKAVFPIMTMKRPQTN